MLMEDQAGGREYERAYMLKRIEKLKDRVDRLYVVPADQNLGDDSSDESEPDGHDDGDDTPAEGDITELASRYCTTGRELTESCWNPYWESLERTEERSMGDGTSSWMPGVAARSGSYETTLCDGGVASSTTASPAASISEGSTDGQSEKCPICLRKFVTQETVTPEACNHTFCAECLQEWSKNTNTCPTDRQVCDLILVWRCRGGRSCRRIHVKPPRQQGEMKL
jgi:hypothetical protein